MVEGARSAVGPMITVWVLGRVVITVRRRDEHDVAVVAWPQDGYQIAKLNRISNRGVSVDR